MGRHFGTDTLLNGGFFLCSISTVWRGPERPRRVGGQDLTYEGVDDVVGRARFVGRRMARPIDNRDFVGAIGLIGDGLADPIVCPVDIGQAGGRSFGDRRSVAAQSMRISLAADEEYRHVIEACAHLRLGIKREPLIGKGPDLVDYAIRVEVGGERVPGRTG